MEESVMFDNIKGLFVTAIFSASGVAGSYYWYETGKSAGLDYTDKVPIARLASALNEVQRKPITRVVWYDLSENADLYTGEAIRTSDDAEATIKFLDSGTQIELEPGSLIVLEEKQGQLQLDFLDGNVFVKAGNTAQANSIVLKSGNRKIDVSKAEVSLAKGDGTDVNLRVFKGNAAVTSQDGKTINLDDKSKAVLGAAGVAKEQVLLNILYPKLDQNIYIDTDKQQYVEFKWKAIDPKFDVILEAGANRDSLQAVTIVSKDLKNGSLKAKVNVGRVYWRLVAIERANRKRNESDVLRNKIIAKLPPVLLSPESEEAITLKISNPILDFSWANPAKLVKPVIQVATDPQLKNIIYTQSVNDSNSINFKFQKSGIYYWRVSAYLDGSNEGVSSRVQKFDLTIGVQLVPPKIQAEESEKTVSYQDFKENGMSVKWENVPGMAKYKLSYRRTRTVKGEELALNASPWKDIVTANTFAKVPELEKAGFFEWKVVSINEKGEQSKSSQLATFKVGAIPKLQWLNAAKEETYYYATPKPSVKMQWQNGPRSTVRYRYKFGPANKRLDELEWKNNGNKLEFYSELEKEGKYKLQIEAIGANDIILSRSVRKVVNVEMRPLLGAPQFKNTDNNAYMARKNGSVQVEWDNNLEAKEYLLELKDLNGKIITSKRSRAPASVFNGLLPGNYKVGIKSVDKFNRIGPAGEEVNVVVPDKSNIRAPKLKRLKINR